MNKIEKNYEIIFKKKIYEEEKDINFILKYLRMLVKMLFNA